MAGNSLQGIYPSVSIDTISDSMSFAIDQIILET